jgi:hypothetical protein
MRYIALVALSIDGTRVEKGGEIDLSPESAARYDKADLVPAEEAVEDKPEVEAPPVALADMTLDQLKEKAKELALSTTGSKAAVLERIQLHLEGGSATESEGE